MDAKYCLYVALSLCRPIVPATLFALCMQTLWEVYFKFELTRIIIFINKE